VFRTALKNLYKFQHIGKVFIGAVFLLGGCTESTDTKETKKVLFDWEGSPDEFRKTFAVVSGRFNFTPENKLFSGKVQLTGSTTYNLGIQEGIPVKFVKDISGRPIQRWYQYGCWIGVDTAWEEDFRETENGLLYFPQNELFSGKVFSIDENSGQILAEYTYVKGISHGPEIYYDEDMKEDSRIDWVNGVIPVQKL